jgi:hypothetical protein
MVHDAFTTLNAARRFSHYRLPQNGAPPLRHFISSHKMEKITEFFLI